MIVRWTVSPGWVTSPSPICGFGVGFEGFLSWFNFIPLKVLASPAAPVVRISQAVAGLQCFELRWSSSAVAGLGGRAHPCQMDRRCWLHRCPPSFSSCFSLELRSSLVPSIFWAGLRGCEACAGAGTVGCGCGHCLGAVGSGWMWSMCWNCGF